MNAMLCLALVLGAPAVKEKAGPAAGLEGEWQAVTLNNDGEVAPVIRPRSGLSSSRSVWRLFRDGQEITAPPHLRI